MPPYSWTASPTQVIQQEQQNASALISVAIGTSVTSISGYAFYECTNLTSITIPTANNAFENSGLTNVTIINNQQINGQLIPSPASNVSFFGSTVSTSTPS